MLKPRTAPPFSRKAAKLTQELTTVEKLVEIAIKALALINNKGRQGLNPLGYHATERTLKTLQLIQENYDQVSQREFLLIVEEVVEFRSRELTKLFELTLQLRERDQIDKVISEIFSLC